MSSSDFFFLFKIKVIYSAEVPQGVSAEITNK